MTALVVVASLNEAISEGKQMDTKKKILVVDDDPDFNLMIQKFLKKNGFEVDFAYNGAEGLKKIKENPPDAVVLDVMMPEKTGYELCEELKSDARYADIPVVLLTSVASRVTFADMDVEPTQYSHHQGKCTEADDYLEKPASAQQILETVLRLVNP